MLSGALRDLSMNGCRTMMTVGSFKTDMLKDLSSELPVMKEDSTVMTDEETWDTDTVTTMAESLGSETIIKEPLDDGLRDLTTCGCKTRWSIVVNGVQYFGCAKPKGSLSLGNADANNGTPGTHMETVKEPNRQLLIQDRIVQAGRKKVRNTKCFSMCSSHVQKLQTVEEEKIWGREVTVRMMLF